MFNRVKSKESSEAIIIITIGFTIYSYLLYLVFSTLYSMM